MNPRSPASRFPDPRLMRAIVSVEESLDAAWSVEGMASTAGLSESRFAHLFRETVGESPAEYLVRLRLERAAAHLIHSEWPVTEVAMAAGYASHAGFTHAFTNRFGGAPTTFRARNRRTPFLRGWNLAVGPRASTKRGPPAQTGPVEVVSLPPFRIAYLRQWGGILPFPRAWTALADWARSRGLAGPDAQPVGCNYDDFRVTPRDRCRYDAGIVVAPDFDDRGEVAVRDVPGGFFAQAPFRGTALGLSRAWSGLVEDWLPASGFQPRTLFAFDRYPADLLSRSRLEVLIRMNLRIRATLCVPLLRAGEEPAEVWAGRADSTPILWTERTVLVEVILSHDGLLPPGTKHPVIVKGTRGCSLVGSCCIVSRGILHRGVSGPVSDGLELPCRSGNVSLRHGEIRSEVAVPPGPGHSRSFQAARDLQVRHQR